ncbi:helix-turn-helix domain-containing protein [Streptomyces diacarni]|uniref:helix-turn-helix domain-containing protein n=1 Tax=Streptomyces diacarni TaxID=2800381 RepID=UPI0033E4E9CF
MIGAPTGATWYRGVDLIAVERIVTGTRPFPALTQDEQRYAVVTMTSARVPVSEIADRLGIAERTVQRWQSEAGEARHGRP